ncbi:hypothetical protein RND71_031722 [Anisodus tanguticus]|uniref:Uncharacterized protein n=1 Tax=Anisodus tanguticus TaxID=243964 RepID=A0AAE1UZ56_9SOLA|nr:hypothetical protein RND71_031722 [Anisodus tanguticus]
MEKYSGGLSHLFMTVFLSCFSTFMVIPPMTDITLSAICPGQDECSLAIYLTGAQKAIVGLGSLVMMPVLGNLSHIWEKSHAYCSHDSFHLPSSSTFLHAAIVSFFVNVAQVGLEASLLVRSISQLLLMPILAPAFGEDKLLSIGLFFSCLHMLLYSIAWSSWVVPHILTSPMLFGFSEDIVALVERSKDASQAYVHSQA